MEAEDKGDLGIKEIFKHSQQMQGMSVLMK